MADQTPAWREIYSRIADGFVSRYPTYWGAIDWLTQIGDDPKRAHYPEQVMATLPEPLRGKYNRFDWTWTARGGGASTAFMVLPQNRELAAFIYEAAANAAGWNDARRPASASSTGLLLARELGDDAAVARLAEAAEREYEPRFFGPQNEMFGWWFGLNEGFPRGQQSAMMMVAEVGRGGDWMRAFEAPHLDKFAAPTVEGIEFPSLGVYQAWNDVESGTLHVGTYPAALVGRGGQPWRRSWASTARIDGQWSTGR